MKVDRHEQAKILSPLELSQLFTVGLKLPRDRALFGVCLYTGTRIAEACSLHTKDVYAIDGSIRPRVTIRKGTTKGKIETRFRSINVFTPYWKTTHRLRGIEGAITYSFCCTCLTQMHYSNVPLRMIQKIFRPKTLSALQKHLEVLHENLESAISPLKF